MNHETAPSYPYRIPFDVEPMNYSEALDHLTHIVRLGICPMLETVVEMLDELGRPDACYDILQIAGTNGKTSTSRYTAAILAGEGFRCALYTSPELVHYTERMEIAGAPIAPGAFGLSIAAACEAGRRVNARRQATGQRPYDITEFDTLTVAACVAFALAEVDVAVLEVGLGGRWDATTATHPQVTAVTGIGLDHTHILGDTLPKIAAEKAAIIKSGQSTVLGTGTQQPQVAEVLLDRCREQGVAPTLVRQAAPQDWDAFVSRGEAPAPAESLPQEASLPHALFTLRHAPSALADALELDLATPRAAYRGLAAQKPGYQAQNIACAAAIAEAYLQKPLNASALVGSVASCPTPGRFQVLRSDPLVLVDAAHNPQSIEAFLAAIRAIEPQADKRPALLCAVLADKDTSGIARLLAPEFPAVYVCQTSSPRALPAPELAQLFRQAGAQVAGTFDSVKQALDATAAIDVAATGSITLAGEVAGFLGKEE